MGKVVAVLAVLGTLLLVSGCAEGDRPTAASGEDPVAAPGASTDPRTPTEASARRQLAALVVTPRPARDPAYRRDAFGSGWIDTDGNGCNQRDDVLLRDAVPGSTRVAPQGRCDHDVLAGTWRDPYRGHLLTFEDLKDLDQAQAIQIDHVVPLAEAWISGARGWSQERRELFANDLGELLAVDGGANASKGDGDPAAWRPRQAYQCRYATRWIAIKHRWSLSADASEVRALGEMLDSC